MTDIQREQIEQALEAELGFRWTPQMRHGHKALKLWESLVNARVEIKRLRAIADATEEFLFDGPGELFQAIRDLRSAVEAAGKEAAEEHAEIERLRAIADAVGELPLGDGVSACVPQPVINAIFAVWTAWKETAEAAGKEAGA